MGDSNCLELIVVGCGKWGTNIIKTAYAMSRLVAVVDSNPSSLGALRSRLDWISDIPMYNLLSKAMDAHKKAAVVVATPPRNILSSDAQKLIAEAQQRGCTLMVDHLLQYSLPHRRLIHLVNCGYVGEVKRVRMRRVNFGTIRTVEDVLWSFCLHDLSILMALFRNSSSSDALDGSSIDVTSVACHGQVTVSDSISDYVNLFINFSSGAHAHVEASWLHPLKERQVVVYGTNGSIILNEAMPDRTLPKIQVYKWSAKRRADGTAVDAQISQDELERYLKEHPEDDAISFSSDSQPLRSALEHFIDCAQSKSKPRTDGEEALRVLTLLNAASESMKKHGCFIPISHADQRREIINGVSEPFIHPSAIVDHGAEIGDGTKIWHFGHVMGGAKIGKNCNIGQNVFIGNNAILGNGVKVQNNVSVYDGVQIDDDVFLGPSCVLTNVKTPRSHISRKHEFLPTRLKKGVTVGANATIVCGVTLGEYCFVGAGAVITKEVPAHGLVYGNPATLMGWVSETGARLVPLTDGGQNKLRCPETNKTYRIIREGERERIEEVRT